MRLTTLGGRLARFWKSKNPGSIDIQFIFKEKFDQGRLGWMFSYFPEMYSGANSSFNHAPVEIHIQESPVGWIIVCVLTCSNQIRL
jgi:hypothetical protein